MPLLINVIHYNSSFLDENIVAGIIRYLILKEMPMQDMQPGLELRPSE